jgi:hypothetical protein
VVWFAIMVRPAGQKRISASSSEKAEAITQQIGDSQDGGVFAGSIGFLNAEPAGASCELGHVSDCSHLSSNYLRGLPRVHHLANHAVIILD